MIFTLFLHYWICTLKSENKTPNLTPLQSEVKEEKQSVSVVERRIDFNYPSNWGQAGIFRTRSAEGLREEAISFGIGGEFYSITDAPNLGYGNTNASTLAESLFVGYSPIQSLTLSLMRRNSSTTFGDPQTLFSSLGDFTLGASYSFGVGSGFWLAPWLDFQISSNFNNLAPSGNTLSGGVGVAGTWNLFPSSGVPFYLHANAGFHSPQMTGTFPSVLAPEIYFQFYRYSQLIFSVGAEYRMANIIPFVEILDTIPLGSSVSFLNSPSRLSLGSRFTPFDNKSLAFLLGFEVGIGRGVAIGVPFTPGYQILGQLSYTVGLTQTERKHFYSSSHVRIVDRKFNFTQNINFKVASAEIEGSSQPILKEIAKVIRENNVKKLLIIGHTDSTHTDEYNLKLSLDRANSVKRFLISEGIAEEVFLTQGYGKRKPRTSNLTEAGRAENRRVEFFVIDS